MKQTQLKPFIEKYRPKTTADLVGNSELVVKLKNYISNYSKQKKRAALIYGPPGSGKTSCVHALANELNFEILEINASDFRNKDKINSIVGGAINQRSLFGKSKIILIDEADGIAGREDAGGVLALTTIMKKSSFPVILTANDAYNDKISSIRKESELIEFKALTNSDILKILKKTADKEKIVYEEFALSNIARNSAGDLRAALNDLESLSSRESISEKDSEFLSERQKEETILNGMMRVLKSTKPEIALGSFDNVKEDMDQIFLWMDENVPKEYTDPEDLAQAYEILSRADVFRGRIIRRQHWGFMAYIYQYLTAGIALAKKEKYKSFVQYKQSSRILTLWLTKQKREKVKSIAKKIGVKVHCSISKANNDYIPYVKFIFSKNKIESARLSQYFEFSEEEMMFLQGK